MRFSTLTSIRSFSPASPSWAARGGPARGRGGAGVAVEGGGAALAVQRVGPGAAGERVGQRAAGQRVAAGAADDGLDVGMDVVALTAVAVVLHAVDGHADRRAVGRVRDDGSAGAAGGGVVFGVALERVGAG